MSKEIIENPYKDWKDKEQCFGAYARAADGRIVSEGAKTAVKFCASGYLYKDNSNIKEEFKSWIVRKFGRTVIDFNDFDRKKPRWFREQWDLFMEERNK